MFGQYYSCCCVQVYLFHEKSVENKDRGGELRGSRYTLRCESIFNQLCLNSGHIGAFKSPIVVPLKGFRYLQSVPVQNSNFF